MIRSGKRCIVPECETCNMSRTCSMFAIPYDYELAQEWLINCHREDLKRKHIDDLHRTNKVCGKHFQASMFLNDLKMKLQPDAIPTIFDFNKNRKRKGVSLEDTKDIEDNVKKKPPIIVHSSKRKSKRLSKSCGAEDPAFTTEHVVDSVSSTSASTSTISTVHDVISTSTSLPNFDHRCVVTECPTNRKKEKFSFFIFPNKPEKAKIWLKNCGRTDLLKKSIDELSKSYRLCGKHFETKMFTSNVRKKLLPNAIPTIFDNKNVKSVAKNHKENENLERKRTILGRPAKPIIKKSSEESLKTVVTRTHSPIETISILDSTSCSVYNKQHSKSATNKIAVTTSGSTTSTIVSTSTGNISSTGITSVAVSRGSASRKNSIVGSTPASQIRKMYLNPITKSIARTTPCSSVSTIVSASAAKSAVCTTSAIGTTTTHSPLTTNKITSTRFSACSTVVSPPKIRRIVSTTRALSTNTLSSGIKSNIKSSSIGATAVAATTINNVTATSVSACSTAVLVPTIARIVSTTPVLTTNTLFSGVTKNITSSSSSATVATTVNNITSPCFSTCSTVVSAPKIGRNVTATTLATNTLSSGLTSNIMSSSTTATAVAASRTNNITSTRFSTCSTAVSAPTIRRIVSTTSALTTNTLSSGLTTNITSPRSSATVVASTTTNSVANITPSSSVSTLVSAQTTKNITSASGSELPVEYLMATNDNITLMTPTCSTNTLHSASSTNRIICTASVSTSSTLASASTTTGDAGTTPCFLLATPTTKSIPSTSDSCDSLHSALTNKTSHSTPFSATTTADSVCKSNTIMCSTSGKEMNLTNIIPMSQTIDSVISANPVSSIANISSSSSQDKPSKQKKEWKRKKRVSAKPKIEYVERELTIDDFDMLCDKYLVKPNLSKFVKNQARLATFNSQESEYEESFKEFVLTIYNMFPNCYPFLRELFYLPSRRTIRKEWVNTFKATDLTDTLPVAIDTGSDDE